MGMSSIHSLVCRINMAWMSWGRGGSKVGIQIRWLISIGCSCRTVTLNQACTAKGISLKTNMTGHFTLHRIITKKGKNGGENEDVFFLLTIPGQDPFFLRISGKDQGRTVINKCSDSESRHAKRKHTQFAAQHHQASREVGPNSKCR